jgi:hypothetical protein
MDLFEELTSELDKAAPRLKGVGRTARTTITHDAIQAIAPKYADELGIGYGRSRDQPGKGGKTLYVHRAGGKPRQSLGGFLFDQCWLVSHWTGNDDAIFGETGEPSDTYPSSCELAVESEWDSPQHQFDDFLKLVLCKGRFKLFVINCREADLEGVELRLRSYLLSFEQRYESERYMISIFREEMGKFHHRVFDPNGVETWHP